VAKVIVWLNGFTIEEGATEHDTIKAIKEVLSDIASGRRDLGYELEEDDEE
jgi:hypothetical protein